MKILLSSRAEHWLRRLDDSTGGSYLFYGPKGVGKTTAATELAKRLGSDRVGGVFRIVPAADSKSGKIGIYQIKTLQEELSLDGYYHGKSRVIVIDPADQMTSEAQNALLKTLEEPPQNTFIILIATDSELLLPTVRSRVQSVYFAPLSESQIKQHLAKNHQVSSTDSAIIARLSRGQAGVASDLANDPEAKTRLTKIAGFAGKAIRASVFERLLLVPEILSLDPRGSQFLTFLAAAIGKRIRDNQIPSTNGATSLESIEKTGRYVAANLNPKAALEGLMLELAC